MRHFQRRVELAFDLDGGRIAGFECECPHHDETGLGCEHAWALLLALAEERAPAEPEAAALRPRYVALAAETEREGALVLALSREDGSPLALDLDAWSDLDDARDEETLRHLAPDAGGFARGGNAGGFARPRGPYRVAPSRGDALLDAAVGTGRLHLLRERGGRTEAIPLVAGAPLELVLRPRRRPDGDFDLRAYVSGEDAPETEVANLAFFAPGETGRVVVGERLHSLRAHGAAGWVRRLRRGDLPPIPPARIASALAALAAETALPRLALAPDADPLPLVARPGAPVVRLESRDGGLRGRVFLDYDGLEVRAGAPGGLLHDLAGGRSLVRDPDAEAEALAVPQRLGAEAAVEDLSAFLLPDAELAEVASAFLAAGFRVVVDGRRARGARREGIRVASDRDWFRVEGGVSAEGEPRPLGAVLDGLRAGDRVAVCDDELLVLSPDDARALEALLPLAAIGEREDGALRLSPGQAALAGGLLGDDAERDEAFRRARETIAGGAHAASDVPPSGLRGELRPYQRAGLAWLRGLDELGLGGCLADDMGLGKTIQTIAWLLGRRASARAPFLLVVPRSLVGNWCDELGRFAPELAIHRHDGPDRDLDGARAGAVVITTYGILRRDAEPLAASEFDAVVLDEAQAIKNPSSATARAARGLRAERRLALSGTPIENDLAELWSLFAFLDPGLLGSRRSFLGGFRSAAPEALAALNRALAPLLLRRTKEEVAPELPELVEQTILCDMAPEQARRYEELRLAARAELLGARVETATSARVLEALLRLRQIACDPRLVGAEDERSGKTELAVERLEAAAARGSKSLVFSQFTGLLDLVERDLARLGRTCLRLDGSTRDRETPVRRFQEDPDALVFLISLKAGGTGLNLTAADQVLVLDPWWNPAAEAQAIARAHRIGRKGSVLACRLVSRGTVEEDILELQRRKRDLADAVIGGEPGATVGFDDLELLLRAPSAPE
ncbi:MAG: DEAD/DEAH box helicase [Planctomycetota bacterium]